MATFVLVHGSWLGGWCWRRVTPLLRAAGHDVFAPTLSGLGDRAHLGGSEIDLGLHITDICATILCEDLTDVVLVGHSYAGMVITGVADSIPQHIAQLIYLDAVVPEPGSAVFDMIPPEAVEQLRTSMIRFRGRRCFPPASSTAMGVTIPPDAAWLEKHSVPMPIATHEQRLKLRTSQLTVRGAYVACSSPALDALGSSRKRAQDAGWRYFTLATGHDPMITSPKELCYTLLRCLG
jgi:pimeloyl-ACP methyl ester carboxylesterase